MAVRPIVIAYHLIWTGYGWWLPNDPRGSQSQTIRCDLIAELGELHRGRKKVQPASRDLRNFYAQAARQLKHPLLQFSSKETQCVVDAFAETIHDERYTCYACAILPEHVHLLIRKHKHSAEQMIERLQESSRLRLSGEGLRSSDHPVWARGGWKVFLDHPDEIRRTIRYVNKNPANARLTDQIWPFVQLYDGWPLHEGHSTNSPYVRRLKAAGRYPHDR